MESEIYIHPDAAGNINKRANEILSLVHEVQTVKCTENSSFKSERIICHDLDEHEYTVDYEERIDLRDAERKAIEFSFDIGGRKFCLDKDCYHLVTVLSRQIISCFHNKISEKFSMQLIYNWIKSNNATNNNNIVFDRYLEEEARKNIRDITCYIPIANLEVEESFFVGKHELRPLSEKIINEWAEKLSSKATNDSSNDIKSLIEDIRREWQGLAVVVCKYNSEEYHAHALAREEANKIISILAIFFREITIPNIRLSLGKAKENDFVSSATSISFAENRLTIYKSFKSVMKAVPYHRLDKKYIKLLNDLCFEKISCLLAKEEKMLNKFQERMLASLFMYSKSAFTSEPTEKIVYTLTSLEIILLKNASEPIQQNLAERFAFFSSNEYSKRKELVNIIKKIYSIRSNYLHHGYSSYELEISSKFMREVWLFFMQLIAVSDCFQTKDDFVGSIDDKKFGGGILLPKNVV
jgi:hypothetical protein